MKCESVTDEMRILEHFRQLQFKHKANFQGFRISSAISHLSCQSTVLVEMGEIIELENDKPDRKELTRYLGDTLEKLCDKQFYDISHANFAGYDTLFQQKLKWYRRIEQRLKQTGIKRSGV